MRRYSQSPAGRPGSARRRATYRTRERNDDRPGEIGEDEPAIGCNRGCLPGERRKLDERVPERAELRCVPAQVLLRSIAARAEVECRQIRNCTADADPPREREQQEGQCVAE